MHDLPFSVAARAGHWRALGAEDFDLLVVGGGITGAGTALDAAGRGLSVALVEAGDFGEGTSSRSSRLIHGGLRYLETLDLGLVFEALGERSRLLELAPHLVRPLPFLFPVYRGDDVGPLKLRAGMWLYDALTLFRGIRAHRMLDAAGAARREPGLRREGLRGGAVYYDAQVDDARLTLAVARAAHLTGARTVSHARVVGFEAGEAGVPAARVRDELGGGETTARARLVVNATGPWSDEVRRMADPAATPRLRPTKGVHVVVPRERVGNGGAIIFRSAVDGRVMFVLPWGRFTYIGTTDTDFSGAPEDARADTRDVDYLLASANALFPGAGLEPADVVSAWAGVRPLLAPDPEERGISASQTSREHDIWRDPSGLLNVAGGKLTTYRTMAAEVAEAAASILRREHGVESGDFFTEALPLPGAPERDWRRFEQELLAQAAMLRLPRESAEHLAWAYGEEAETILERIRNRPELGHPILSPHPYLWAEIPHAVENEMAATLEDVLRRRLHLFYEARDGGVEVAREVVAAMAEQPGLAWTPQETERQVAAYTAAVRDTRV